MAVTPEMIGTIVAVFGAVATLFGGFSALQRRLENRLGLRFEQVDSRLDGMDERLDRFEERMDQKIEGLRDEIRVVSTDVVDLKVAVARLEGPQPRLLRAR